MLKRILSHLSSQIYILTLSSVDFLFYLLSVYLDSIFICDVIKGCSFIFSLTLCTRFDLCCCISIFVCLEAQSCPTLCNPMGYSLPGSSVHGASPGKNTGVDGHALLQGNLPNRGMKPRSPALQAASLLTEPPEKPISLFITY